MNIKIFWKNKRKVEINNNFSYIFPNFHRETQCLLLSHHTLINHLQNRILLVRRRRLRHIQILSPHYLSLFQKYFFSNLIFGSVNLDFRILIQN